jgi:hypothetical protein
MTEVKEKRHPDYAPKQTLYINNLNEKVKIEGKLVSRRSQTNFVLHILQVRKAAFTDCKTQYQDEGTGFCGLCSQGRRGKGQRKLG